jgi:hypothetical protein
LAEKGNGHETHNKNMINSFKHIAIILCISMGQSSLYARKLPHHHHAKQDQQQGKEVWVNVFVHGIMSIKPHLSWNNFIKFIKDDIENTNYQKTVTSMREDPFFFKNQAMQQLGFHAVDTSQCEENSSANLSHIFDEVRSFYGISQNNKYYTFGWCGLLSSKCRYKESKLLYHAVDHEVKRLRREGYDPKVRFYGYSHGGNVCLNVPLHKSKHSKLSIDELIMIGTPVISDSDYLINDDMFKRVFHLYSLTDRVQTLDLFAPNQFFSNRTFKPRKGFALPDKLIQIQIKVTRCTQRAKFCPRRFSLSTNLEKPRVVFGRSGLLRDISPGHAELWFFGWTPLNYRSHFPLYPLPVISFAPVITYHASKMSIDMKPEDSIVADIRPQHNVILFRRQNSSKIHSTVPYLSPEKIDSLTNKVMLCKPPRYDETLYKEHVQKAIEKTNNQ